MPKVEIEVMYTRTVTEEGSKIIELNVPAAMVEDEDEIASWLQEQIDQEKIDFHEVIYKGSDINDTDMTPEIDEVHFTS